MLFRTYWRLGDSVFARKSWSSGNFIFARNDHGFYCIPVAASWRPAAKCVMAGDVWERKTVEFMLEHCRGAEVVTAGAFFGDALPALSKVCRRVWAFEPNPDNYQCAQITVLLNDLRNVALRQTGLGERCEQRKLVVKDWQGRSLGGGSQIADITDRGHEAVAIDLVTIDSVVDERSAVSIIHLDVEGFEEYALRGAQRTMERCRPLLILETVPKGLDESYQLERQLDEQTYLLSPVSAEGAVVAPP
jgi:FkbM family methyltransferase